MPSPTAVHVAALGTVFRLEVEDPSLRAELSRLWRPLLVTPPASTAGADVRVIRTAAGWEVQDGPAAVGEAPDVQSVLALLGTHLNGAAIRQCPDLLVHAGAVAHEGAVVALAAVSGGGKSTLTAACVLQGWDYVSDEALRLRDDGIVRAYAKPLSLDASSLSVLSLGEPADVDEGEVTVGVADLRGRLSHDELRLAEVVFLSRSSDGHPPAELLPLHASEVLTGLLALSFNHYKAPAQRVALLAAAAARSRAWRLRYSDARQAAGVLSEAFRRPQPQDEAPQRRDGRAGQV